MSWFLSTFSHPYLHSHSAFSSPHLPLFPFLPLSHNAHSNSVSHICSLCLILDDSYPCLIPLTVHLCLTFSLPFTCTVPLCVLACAYVCKHVSDLPWGRLFFSSPQGAAFLPPFVLSLSPFCPCPHSLHFVVYLWKVIGRLLNSLLVRLSCSREWERGVCWKMDTLKLYPYPY